MRTIKMTTGANLPLDGDLLTLVETLYLEISAKHELQIEFRGHGARDSARHRRR